MHTSVVYHSTSTSDQELLTQCYHNALLGIPAATGDRGPPERLDHLQRQEQGVLRLADSDGEQSVPQRRTEHRGDGGETKEGTAREKKYSERERRGRHGTFFRR